MVLFIRKNFMNSIFNANNIYYLVYLILAIPILYLISVFIFDFLLRGFSPFIKSRPWVSEQILNDLRFAKRPKKMLALSTGRSGFFYELGKVYKDAELVAIEPSLFQYFVAKVQGFVRGTRLKIYHREVLRTNVKDYDFIYSHLYPDAMQGLGPKLKFECTPGTIILSTGFNIPTLIPKKVIALPDRKGKLNFLSKNQKLLQSKRKKHKKENKAFLYEI
jgi:hypothetical protein